MTVEDGAERRTGWFGRQAPGVGRRAGPSRTPKDLWVRCAETGELCYRPDLEAALWVTPSGHHMRIAGALRFAATFDDGRFTALPSPPAAADDPLAFNYGKPYRPALAAARKARGTADAMSAAAGEIGGVAAVVLVQDFGFLAASVSRAVGEAFVTATEAAIQRRAGLVTFTSGAGMRMQEGALALMQMARITVAIQRLKDAGLPYIVVLTDPTTGGTMASYAMLGDVTLAEPAALVGFSGKRVTAQTIRETMPDDCQTAEYQVGVGMVDRVTPRRELPGLLGAVLRTRLPVTRRA